MTATQISSRPSASTRSALVCRPLTTVASRGFDQVCLLQMQDAAFRYAAQSRQHNKSSRCSGMSLGAIVDQQLGGTGHAHADVSPGDIAAYMRAKAFFSQLPQRDAMFDVAVLSTAQLALGQGTGPRLDWLAQTLVGLQRDADRLAAKTPMFAAEIATQVRRTVAKRTEIDGLPSARRAVVTRAAIGPDEDHIDGGEYPRTSIS